MPFQTIYVSAAVGKPSQQDLEAILDQARRNNCADDITGLLLYHDGNFFQVLEGPQEKVEACYARIREDSRHSGCLVLHAGEIEDRNFASWDMGFIPFSYLSVNQQINFVNIRDIWNSPKIGEKAKRNELGVLLDTFLSTLRRI